MNCTVSDAYIHIHCTMQTTLLHVVVDKQEYMIKSYCTCIVQ